MSPRRLAFRILLLALAAILATGFYLAVTHQETRPADSQSLAPTGSTR